VIGTATVIRGDARNLPLPDDSVDLIVTSPPYFALRSYQDGGQHYVGQIGDEPTPAQFVESLLEVTRECVRVLKPSGSLWVNLGDKYAASSNGTLGHRAASRDRNARARGRNDTGIPNKSLIGIPWRYAVRCIDDLGLILRAEVIWSKPNGLPESVTDRVRRSHEQWFHFTLEPRYFSAVDEVRGAHAESSIARAHITRKVNPQVARTENSDRGDKGMIGAGKPWISNPLGKLPGSVRTVPTEPLRVPDHLGIDHFAAFPTAWPKWIIQGWAPTRGVCEACGEGRRPVCHRKPMGWRPGPKAGGYELDGTTRRVATGTMLAAAETTITGYACACPDTTAPTRPAVILDPFGGTGTTALVAKALGCHGISVDMSADYCRLAQWRTNDSSQLAKVLDVDKPPEVAANQTDLFDLIGGDAA
jgi:DNA modification methylase